MNCYRRVRRQRMISNSTTLILIRQHISIQISMLISWQSNDRSECQSSRMLIWLMKRSLWSIWRSAFVCFESHDENCFLTVPSRHIRRSDIEWRWLRRLIEKHVVIVKEAWELAAQPSAQWIFERLVKPSVVWSVSKNDKKTDVSWVSFAIILQSIALALLL